jgi:hemin uptake protein HemP
MARIYDAFMLQNNPAKPVAQRPLPPEVVSAAQLLRDRRELLIEHDGERYRLSLTKNGKLILTK